MDYKDDDFVTIKVACEVVGGPDAPVHPATIHRGVKAGRFKKYHPTPGISRFKYGELKAATQRSNQSEVA